MYSPLFKKILTVCVLGCGRVCVNVGTHVLLTTYGAQGATTRDSLHLPCLRQGLVFTAVYAKLAGPQASKNSFSLSTVSQKGLRLQVHMTTSGFTWVLRIQIQILVFAQQVFHSLSLLPSPVQCSSFHLGSSLNTGSKQLKGYRKALKPTRFIRALPMLLQVVRTFENYSQKS